MKGQELAGGTLAADAIDRFSRPTRDWFLGAFSAPTPAQNGAWNAISSGAHALVVAPTGSGKTLAAFLWALDRLLVSAPAEPESLPGLETGKGPRRKAPKRNTRVLYISPLKALGVDVERNLRAPLIGITQTAKRLGLPAPLITVGVRSGDTPASDRRALLSNPPDILITTPESLFLMLTSKARETLRERGHRHRRRGPRRRGHQTRRAPGRVAGAPRRPAAEARRSGSGSRPPWSRKELVAQFLAGSAPVEIVAPPSKKNWDLTGLRPGGGHVRSAGARPARSTPARRPGCSRRRPSGRTWRRRSSTWSWPTSPPSCSPIPAGWPNGSPPGSTRSTPSGSSWRPAAAGASPAPGHRTSNRAGRSPGGRGRSAKPPRRRPT